MKLLLTFLRILIAVNFMCSCSVFRYTGEAIDFTGKVARTTINTTGTVLMATGKVIQTSVGMGRATVRYFSGQKTIKLERHGNSYYVRVIINKHYKARLLLDTGASSVQISSGLAGTMGIGPSSGKTVDCVLADGSVITAKLVTLNRLEVGTVSVNNVSAVILANNSTADSDGLLGMSFLNNFDFQIDTKNDLLILQYRE